MKRDRYTADGARVLLQSKFLIKWRGRRIDLHKIIDHDPPGAFHSHPANAIRIILWGGYEEELIDGTKRRWRPGMIGIVPGPLCHRLNQVSAPTYTIWIRGKDQFKPRMANTTKLYSDAAPAA